MNKNLLSIVNEKFNAERALTHCAELYKTDSHFTFADFHTTSQTVAEQMKAAGLEQVEIHSFAADGRTKYGDWIVPRAWDAAQFDFSVTIDSEELLLAGRHISLCSLFMYSAPTPQGKPVSCSIVSSANPGLFNGNLVFSDTLENLSPQKLSDYGAIGVITDEMPFWNNCRSREDVMDVTLWNNSYLAPGNDYNLIGIQLTPEKGDLLRKLLVKGTAGVQANVRVDTQLYDGTIDFVTGILPGCRPEEEVAVFSHLYEPGANDNASGCAMTIEALQTLKEQIDIGALQPLSRSIRLCFTFEIFGSLAYFSKFPERAEKIVAGINPDMVAPDLDKVKSKLHLFGTPDSVPSYTDALLAEFIEKNAQTNHLFRWSEKNFFINDNIVTDPVIGIPCPALVCVRDRFYHSDHDCMENLSPDTMQLIGGAVTAYLYSQAQGELSVAINLVDKVLGRELQKIHAAAGKGGVMVGVPPSELLSFRTDSAMRRLDSIYQFLVHTDETKELRIYMDMAKHTLKGFSDSCVHKVEKLGLATGSEWNEFINPDKELKNIAEKLFPRKKMIGTYALTEWYKSMGYERGDAQWSCQENAPIFWADGMRSIYDIWRAWCLEFLKPRKLNDLIKLFTHLNQKGYVTMLLPEREKGKTL